MGNTLDCGLSECGGTTAEGDEPQDYSKPIEYDASREAKAPAPAAEEDPVVAGGPQAPEGVLRELEERDYPAEAARDVAEDACRPRDGSPLVAVGRTPLGHLRTPAPPRQPRLPLLTFLFTHPPPSPTDRLRRRKTTTQKDAKRRETNDAKRTNDLPRYDGLSLYDL
eukprot:CAMPEP_0118918692 /NCGR_PEP_ID=MMETSP1166-20130328/18077_1 /TAXON_ID=1104430 /ORGANISM="Chrysoreinhardia sp, Strain CCMP3193" /LENGTH=166 /DNA_ID=CAMNT_0006859039 /DNA_START=20 /DNA_END=519 /DNA_ORIENTATION=-